MWLSSTSGYSWPTRVTTSRHSCDTSRTFDLSTDVSRPRRRCADRKATCAILSTCCAPLPLSAREHQILVCVCHDENVSWSGKLNLNWSQVLTHCDA